MKYFNTINCCFMRPVLWGKFGVIVVSLLFIGSSCQNFSTSFFNDKNSDTLKVYEEIKEKIVPKPLLKDTWDSLRKNQIVFSVDTLQPVPIKEQKKLLKDSLKSEFNKQPKHIFLTFDDGPLVGSFAIDSLAKAKNVKLSTFLVGRHANMGKGRMNDLNRYKENPLIACYNHSYTHAYNKFSHFYSNPQSAFEDFVKNENYLELTHKIARLPGRNIWIYDDVRVIDLNNGSQTADLLFGDGYKIYGWDVEWRINSLTGVPVQSLESTFAKIKSLINSKNSQTPNNVVLLMHDDMFQTKKGRQLLADLIDLLKNENYQFEFMEDYPIKY